MNKYLKVVTAKDSKGFLHMAQVPYYSYPKVGELIVLDEGEGDKMLGIVSVDDYMFPYDENHFKHLCVSTGVELPLQRVKEMYVKDECKYSDEQDYSFDEKPEEFVDGYQD